MKEFFRNNHRLVFYGCWLLLSILQASGTQLMDDEAYYWVYSRFPDWGYFDHPPLVALLIKAGYQLFHSELGVRLFFLLMTTASLRLMELLLANKNPLLFYAIALSIGFLQIGGILAVPDTPLLFFTVLFFYQYRRFLMYPGLNSSIILGLVMSLLFYSKYHGLLVVLFTFISNPQLVKNRFAWLAAFVGMIFYLPHLYWQYQHDWISFRYHLFESNVSTYSFSNTTDYLLGQLLLAGPLAGLLLLPAAFLCKPANKTEKALKYTMVGVYLVFLLSSFRGKVEANWPLVVLVPLVILSHGYLQGRIKWVRALLVITMISLILVTAGRVYLMVDLGPMNSLKKRFHHNREWSEAIASHTGKQPVLFYNSYQRASRYWFYSGIPSHSINDYRERVNNYNFWPTDISWMGDPVYLADIYDMHNFHDSLQTRHGMVGWKVDSLFFPMGKFKLKMGEPEIVNDSLRLRVAMAMDKEVESFYRQALQTHPNIKAILMAGIFQGKESISQVNTGIEAREFLNDPKHILHLDISSLQAGDYYLRLGWQARDYFPTHCSGRLDFSKEN